MTIIVYSLLVVFILGLISFIVVILNESVKQRKIENETKKRLASLSVFTQSTDDIALFLISLIVTGTILCETLLNNSPEHDDKLYVDSFLQFLSPSNIEMIKANSQGDIMHG